MSKLQSATPGRAARLAPRLGASVAFYSILSLAPMIVLIAAVIALVFGHQSAQGALVNEARQWIGDRGAYSAQIFFFGAEFTHLYSETHKAPTAAAAPL